VRQNDESLLKIKDDFTLMERAQNTPMDTISIELSTITDDLQRNTATVDKYGFCDKKQQVSSPSACDGSSSGPNPESADGIYSSSMETFLKSASTEIVRISSSFDELKRNYSSLLTDFCEDPNKKSSDFFGTLNKFLFNFEGAVQFVDRQEKAKVSFCFPILYNGIVLYANVLRSSFKD